MQENRNKTREGVSGLLNNYFIEKDGICSGWEIIISGYDQTEWLNICCSFCSWLPLLSVGKEVASKC